ncbi:phosphoribosyl 1,2-cyclic phosphodiesterase [Chromohalobacter marismortui]|uniref:Phosphoribosyl 1,2-cyclic phosphodiesterase n=1 Tax=Chromohalobacter marismortui TaxID=42055 RepID=A0A4R7NG64_9GAMM|nr:MULTISPECIES: MBL fold metallo-hydrolase [Chromohalobacter]MCI0509427.1 MBL fold metallo-hydrolase [Chromohalobacter sp.]MCI0593048.1 MBL fold metallo-hydrolase [Chromohalobacter sp.]TDU19299.1 phosphoribosyl 1,2-cyclic phosphodiesterase [Chromohalobacter marismortui]
MTDRPQASLALRFASLGSGSKGNATLVSDGETHVLVDCGFGMREAERRLAQFGLHPRQLDAVLLTHEHGDHIRGVGPLARRYALPVYLTVGTWLSGRLGEVPRHEWVVPQSRFAIKGLEIDAVTVPHDAREPVQFRFRAHGRHLGVLTDLGHPSEHVIDAFRGCDALILECNHDRHMLDVGPYPRNLKRRVGGHWGHLANVQAAELLPRLGLDRLQRIVCSHISMENNHPELALEALTPLLSGDASRLLVSAQDHGFAWQSIA